MERSGGTSLVLTAIRTVAETGSTNADVMAWARDGANEGVWLRAGRQTAGRGRQGRVWDSPPGNLSASTLVRLRPGDPPAATLALTAAVALEEAVRLFLPAGAESGGRGQITIKWPNDVLIDGAKLSGILLERVGEDGIVIGFGVNLAHYPIDTDRPATSLAAYGPALDPGPFLEALADIFARWLERWRNEGLTPIRTRWLAHAHPPGTPLTVRLGDGGSLEGLFDSLNTDGALLLRLADGSRQVVHAGDVFLL